VFLREFAGIVLLKKKPEQLIKENQSAKSALKKYIVIAVIYSLLIASALFAREIVGLRSGMQYGKPAYFSQGKIYYSLNDFYTATTNEVVGNFAGTFILLLVASFIMNSVLHIFAKVFKGRGKYLPTITSLFTIDSAFIGTFGIIAAAVLLADALIFGNFALINPFIWSQIAMVIYLYNLALKTNVMAATHGISTGRAICATAVSVVVFFVISLIFLYASGFYRAVLLTV